MSSKTQERFVRFVIDSIRQITWYQVLWLAPAIVYLPLIDLPVTAYYHSPREVAGVFQALAFAQDGFGALLYMTPHENLSAIHLHSLLSAPLISLGYIEGGRLISFIAAIAAVFIVGSIAAELSGYQVAVVAPMLLWVQPLFARFAFAFKPEALSILLTSLILYIALRYDNSGEGSLFVGMLCLIPLATAVHLWEAVIAFPVVALLTFRRQWRNVILTGAVTAGSLCLISWLAALKPMGPGNLTRNYATVSGSNWQLLFDIGWWFHWWPTSNPLDLTTGIRRLAFAPEWGITGSTLPLSLVLCCFFSYRALKERTRFEVVMAAWFASGLAIPLGLTNGYSNHEYYIWALMAPLAISGALLGRYIWESLQLCCSSRGAKATASILLATLVVIGGFGGPLYHPFAAHHLAEEVTQTSGQDVDTNWRVESMQAGETLHRMGIEDAESVRFVGNFSSGYVNSHLFRMLVYGQFVVRERDYSGRYAPVVANESMIENCTVMVKQTNDDIVVSRCG